MSTIGTMPAEILSALLETLPIEFSILDADDKVMVWNKHESRIFKRPEAALGKDVRKCHPEKSLAKVEQILQEMKSGNRDKARFWIDLPLGENDEPYKVIIEYFALRDADGNYLGCLEASQDVSDIQTLQGQKRLLD